MSRPAPVESQYRAASSPTMTDTQSAPNLPPPHYLDYNNRRLPQPVHLPPLAIPHESPRSDYRPSPPPQQLPSIHPGPPPPPPPPRSQPRPYSGPAAPLDKLLSPTPSSYTPPRSDSAYSPHHSPPRSSIDPRPLPPRRHERYHSLDERGQPLPEPHYASASPTEHHRSIYSSNVPSPASTYTPTFSQASHYRSHSGPPHPPPPPPQSQPHQYVSPVAHYIEPAPPGPPPPPPQRIAPAAYHQPSHHSRDRHETLKYELKVRQQPMAARACGFGERDRRVIDPPPIIQLTVSDPETGVVDLDELRYSLNVVHCTLWNEAGTGEETALYQHDRRTTRRLMGQLVASPSVAKDEHDVEGCFFCFPDLSCRTNGKYRLRFVLMRIDPQNLQVGDVSPILTDVLSEVFTVYTAKDFPGMRPSSALTRALKLQGCNIQVKKGNEKALARKRISPSSEDDDAKDAKKRKTE